MRALGIDLGTMYSAVATVSPDGRPRIIPNREGDAITPSVVLFRGEIPLVGAMAKRSAAVAPDDCIQFVKRRMGETSWRFTTSTGQSYTPEEVSAIILKRLKADAEMVSGRSWEDAVITVPAYFDDIRRRATFRAGQIAGLNVLRVLNEPTAAALAYGVDTAASGVFLVFDLGGGTFDVTIMRVAKGEFDIISTIGDRNLGGFDWDNELMLWCGEQVRTKTGVDVMADDRITAELREKCELAKHTLTTASSARIFLSAHSTTHNITVDRKTFEEITRSLLNRCEDLMDEALDAAKLQWSQIDDILLVGGSTRMPMVSEMVTRVTGKKPHSTINPDEAVALGAAIQAEISMADRENSLPVVTAEGGPIVVRDVTSQSLGVIALNDAGHDYNSIIIAANSKIPCKRNKCYQTVVDRQQQIRVRVTEGDDDDVEYVTVVGTALMDLPPHPAGAPVEVNLSYDVDGIIHVEVNDLTTGCSLGEAEIERDSNADHEEIERMRLALDRLGEL